MDPTNKCEGGAITIRQVVGDSALAAGDYNNVYVIESGGVVLNTLRRWSGSCWERMPTAGLTSSVKEVAIHTGRASGDRWLPWVVLNDGNFFKLDYTAAGFQWVYVPNGWGTAISSATVVGLGDTSLWKFNHTTGVFTHDTTWDKGVIRQMSGGWVIDGNGKGWHWE